MPQENTQKKSDYRAHIFTAFCAVAGSHIFRVCLNRSAYHTNPLDVIRDLPAYWNTGLGLNLLRGVTAISLQSWSKTEVRNYYGDTSTSKWLGWFAATIMGTLVACGIEVPFMRKTTATRAQRMPFTRFSFPITASFAAREAGFSAVVLCSNDLKKHSSQTYYTALFAATWITAIAHKFATWDASADIMRDRRWNTPDFKHDGFRQTFRNLAGGNTYNHPSCAVLFKNPNTLSQLMGNCLWVTCNPTTFFYRGILLAVMGAITDIAPRLQIQCEEYARSFGMSPNCAI